MICKIEDHSLERRLIIEIIILVYFRARVAIGGGADNGAGQVFLALRILTKNMIEIFRLHSKAKTIEASNCQKDKCDFRWQLETMRRLKCYRGT